MNDFSMSHDSPAGGEINVRSPYYFIARTQDICEHCGASMELFALVVPPGHETLDVGDDDVENAPDEGMAADRWVVADHHALLFHIESLSAGVQARLASLTRSFRPERRDPDAAATWVNHCAACGSQMDDDTLFCEPGEAFCPIEEAGIARIRSLRIDEALEAAAGAYSVDPNFMPAMNPG